MSNNTAIASGRVFFQNKNIILSALIKNLFGENTETFHTLFSYIYYTMITIAALFLKDSSATETFLHIRGIYFNIYCFESDFLLHKVVNMLHQQKQTAE